MFESSAYQDELLATAATLPGGYWDAEGNLHREVAVRPISGREEELLAERAGSLSLPALVTYLISRCVLRLGSYAPVTPELARRLLVADRDYLLLKLRQLTFGDRVQAVLVCPACQEKMDLDFEIDQVPVERRVPPRPGAALELSVAAAFGDGLGRDHREVEFRLPIGADQEAIAPFGVAGQGPALDTLFARCVSRLGDIQPVDVATVAGLNTLARAEIEAQMERVAPLVELEMDIHCPQCGHVFVQYFDFAAFLVDEIKLRRSQLYREVHFLALHYHWPESEILALTRKKRQIYLDLLYETRSAGISLGD